jgi:hypothetical protein
MPCGTTDNYGNQTHYCEYPYLKNGAPVSDPYSIRKEQLGGVASDDPVERRRAELIRAICYWCSFFKDDAKKRYEQSIRNPKLYSDLIREISMIMASLMDYFNEAPEAILFEYDERQYSENFVKNIKNNLYTFIQSNYPTVQNPYLYSQQFSRITGGKRFLKSRRKRKSPKRSSRSKRRY